MVSPPSPGATAVKSKFVQIYEDFFKGLDPSAGNPNFWNMLFLVRVDVSFLESQFRERSLDELFALKDTINSVFYHCVEAMSETHPIRVINAMQTLSVIIREVVTKFESNNASNYDQMDILIGFEPAETVMPKLIQSICWIICEQPSMTLKRRAVRLCLVIATAKDNVSQNALLDYFMRCPSLFEAICHVLANGPQRNSDVGVDAVILLLILINYRKYEASVCNPYAMKLSVLDNELALNGLGQIINRVLQEFNRNYALKEYYRSSSQPSGGGIFASLANAMSNILIGDDKILDAYRVNDALLCALYEGVHLNRNFVSVLTRNHSDDTSISFSSPEFNTPRSGNGANVQSVGGDQPSSDKDPSNILVSFFEYMSYILHDSKDAAKFANAKLCLIIVTCLVEDQYASTFLHDSSITFRVSLFQPQMRHKKLVEHSDKPVPLVVSLLDLLCCFLCSHMKKTLPFELHSQALAIVYRIVCHQKKNKIRLVGYNWKPLWEALIGFIKFLVNNDSYLRSICDHFYLALQAVGVFNLFITFGDTFLSDPTSYDQLYYELIRMYNVFDDLYALALQQVRGNGQGHESASRVIHALTNIRSITSHFNPKMQTFLDENSLSSLSSDQVLHIVRTNYDTLALRMQENLDQYERYNEKPARVHFFSTLMRSILHECRLGLPITNVEQKAILEEFATIT